MAATDARPIPRKNVAYRVTFPILDADGDLVTGATGLDSEVSIDGGTFADVTAEATEIATASGMYFLDLTAGEMNGDTVAIIVKTTSSGAKTTPLVLYPEEVGDVRVDVVQWLGTAPATPTVAGVPKVDATHWRGTAVPAEHTAGYPIVTVKDGTGTGEINTNAGAIAVVDLVTTLTTYTGDTPQTGDSFARIGSTGAGLTSLAQAATALSSAVYTSARAGYLDNINVGGAVASAVNLAIVAGYLDTEIAAIKVVTDRLDTTLVLDGAVYQFTANALELAPTGGSAPSAATIADAVWDEARADHVAAGSFGQALDATISSRSTLVAADIRTSVGLGSANLDTQLAAISAFIDVEIGTIITAVAAVQADADDIQGRLPAALVGGRLNVNLQAIDGLTTSDGAATLNLKKLNVVNDAGDAVVASSTGGNGQGFNASGHGTGSGVKGTGGATGHGVYGVGGATSGNGVLGAATGGNSNGIRGTGFGSGSGVHGEGGDTGNGFRGVGGAVSGAGFHGRGVLGNSPGMELVGQGSAAGILSTGGANGPGQRLVGGSTSGTALELAITAGSVYVTTAAVTASFEAIAITAPTGPAGNFREMVVQLWRRFFKKATLSSTELKTYADNGSTVVTTQSVTDAAGLQTEEAAV